MIEETVRETLPDDFQTAEYLLDRGIVDMVVPRKELHGTLSTVLNLVMNPNSGSQGGSKTRPESTDASSKKQSEPSNDQKPSDKEKNRAA